MFVWQIMMGGDRLPDLGWEVRSAGGRWFLSIGELHAAKRVMTWSYGGIFHSATSPCVHVQVLVFFFNPQSSRNRQQFFKRVIYRHLWFAGRDGETDSVEFGKDNGSRYNISPDLALSSSFILHTLPRALPLLHTQCQSPQPICQTFQRAPPVPCQPLGMGWFPCEKPQGQWLYELGFTSLPKANPGQCRMLAEQLVGWGGCWGHQLSSAVIPGVFTLPLCSPGLTFGLLHCFAGSRGWWLYGSFSATFPFAAAGWSLIYTLVQQKKGESDSLHCWHPCC